jgi:dTDP-glucose pyrophosphorylase
MPGELKHLIVNHSATIREAMTTIAEGASRAAAVTGPDGCIVGMLTDGDLRRLLLSGAEMDSPIEPGITRDFTWVGPETSRVQVLDLMQARNIEQIPILDGKRRLIGVHLIGSMFSRSILPNQAVIMAGGRGTRLGELTRATPKPMLKIAGRPILERIVLHLVGSGVRVIYISVNYLSKVIENYFGDGKGFGCEIRYLKEEVPMGTGGALALLPEKPEHPLLVMNGDLVTDFNVRGMLSYHEAGAYAATLGVNHYCHSVPFGCVSLEDGVVSGFREKPLLVETVNCGIYVLSPAILADIPSCGFPITSLIEGCLESGKPVGGYRIEEEWVDIGHPAELEAARGNL